MSKKTLSIGVLAVVAAGITGGAAAAPVTLTIESWRNDDLAIWRDKIIPAFEKQHPDIKVRFAPTAPTEYNAALNSKLDAGTAGDLVTCRPFDASLQLFQKGRLAPLNDLKGMQNFTPVARTAWSTDDGKTTFCVPMASVIHGFIYNKDLLSKAGVTPPTTVDEFFVALNKVKAGGRVVPLAMGTKDGWETASMGYQNIGPNYYKSLVGAQALARELGASARGVVVSQVMPFPFSAKSRLSGDYLSLGRQALGDAFEPSYGSMEGYVAAKTFVEGLRRTGPDITTPRMIAAFESMTDVDFGGFRVGFEPRKRSGSRLVELTILTEEGKTRY